MLKSIKRHTAIVIDKKFKLFILLSFILSEGNIGKGKILLELSLKKERARRIEPL